MDFWACVIVIYFVALVVYFLALVVYDNWKFRRDRTADEDE